MRKSNSNFFSVVFWLKHDCLVIRMIVNMKIVQFKGKEVYSNSKLKIKAHASALL